MLTYSIRLDFTDGTFTVWPVTAGSIAEAFASLSDVAGIASTTLLGSVDDEPQTCLAFRT